MSIIRIKKEREYVSIANAILQNKALTWEARGVMAYLLSKPDGWECRNYDLVNQGPVGKTVIQRVLKELQTAGYIHRYQKSNGHKIEWITEIYETPELNTTSRNTGNLPAEEPTVGKPAGRKPVDIVSTDLQKGLITEKTEMPQNGENDFSDLFGEDDNESYIDIKVPDGDTTSLEATRKTVNGKPLTEAEVAHLQTFGVLPGQVEPDDKIYAIRQEINRAGWEIYSTDVEMAIAHFVQAMRTRHPNFAIPKDTPTRKRWYKDVGGHLQNYSLTDLQSFYKTAIIKMRDADLSCWHPGSLTKWALPEVANENAQPSQNIDLGKGFYV